MPVLKERGQVAVDTRLKHEREMKGKRSREILFFRFSA